MQATANVAHSPNHLPSSPWLLDSGASHNLTNELGNLSIHSEYDGTDEVQIADGTGLPITHFGTSYIHNPSRSFILRNVLYVPIASKNLISVHQFTKANNVSLEFFPDYFLVKDHITGAPVAQGPCSDGVYHIQPLLTSSEPKTTALGVRTSPHHWHARLGHPSQRTSSLILSKFHLPVLNKPMC